MSSYVFVSQHNFQSVLWAGARALATMAGACAMAHTIRQSSTMGLAVCLWAYTLLIAVWPDVAHLVGTVGKVAGVALALASIVAVVAFLPVELFIGLAIVGVYAFVFCPRKRGH